MKHEAQVFDMTSQSRLKIQCNKTCKNNVFPAGMVNTPCKSLPEKQEAKIANKYWRILDMTWE